MIPSPWRPASLANYSPRPFDPGELHYVVRGGDVREAGRELAVQVGINLADG